MLQMDLKSVLISVLLLTLIALVIYLIVLINKLTYTIKNVNAVMDGGAKAANNVKEGVGSKVATVKEKGAIVGKFAGKGLGLVSGIFGKLIR